MGKKGKRKKDSCGERERERVGMEKPQKMIVSVSSPSELHFEREISNVNLLGKKCTLSASVHKYHLVSEYV